MTNAEWRIHKGSRNRASQPRPLARFSGVSIPPLRGLGSIKDAKFAKILLRAAAVTISIDNSLAFQDILT
jgi:hypothetical protein